MAELVVSAGSNFNPTPPSSARRPTGGIGAGPPQQGVGNRIRQQADEVRNLEFHEGLSDHFSPHKIDHLRWSILCGVVILRPSNR